MLDVIQGPMEEGGWGKSTKGRLTYIRPNEEDVTLPSGIVRFSAAQQKMMDEGIPKECSSDDEDLPNSEVLPVAPKKSLQIISLSKPYVQSLRPLAATSSLSNLVSTIRSETTIEGSIRHLASSPFVDDSGEGPMIGVKEPQAPTFANVETYAKGGVMPRSIGRWVGWTLAEWEDESLGLALFEPLVTAVLLEIANRTELAGGMSDRDMDIVTFIKGSKSIPDEEYHFTSLYQFGSPGSQPGIIGAIAIPSLQMVTKYNPLGPPLWVELGVILNDVDDIRTKMRRILAVFSFIDDDAVFEMTWVAAWNGAGVHVPGDEAGYQTVPRRLIAMDEETQEAEGAAGFLFSSTEEEHVFWMDSYLAAADEVWQTYLEDRASGIDPPTTDIPAELSALASHRGAVRRLTEAMLFTSYHHASLIHVITDQDEPARTIDIDAGERAVDVILAEVVAYTDGQKDLCGDGLEFGEMVSKASRVNAIMARTAPGDGLALPNQILINAYSHVNLAATQLAHSSLRFRSKRMPKKMAKSGPIAFSFRAPGGARVNVTWTEVRRADRGRTCSDTICDFALSESGIPIAIPDMVPLNGQVSLRSIVLSGIVVRDVLEKIRPIQEEADQLNRGRDDYEDKSRDLQLQRGVIWRDFLMSTDADAISFVLTDDWNIAVATDQIWNATTISMIGIKDLFLPTGHPDRKTSRLIMAYSSTIAGWEGDFPTKNQAKATERNHSKFNEVRLIWKYTRDALMASVEGDLDQDYDEVRRQRMESGRQAIRGISQYPVMGGGFIAPDMAQTLAKNAGTIHNMTLAHQAALPRPLDAKIHHPPLHITDTLQPYSAFQVIFAAQTALSRVLHSIKDFDRSNGGVPEAPLAVDCLGDGAGLPATIEAYVSTRITHAELAKYEINSGTFVGEATPLSHTSIALGGLKIEAEDAIN